MLTAVSPEPIKDGVWRALPESPTDFFHTLALLMHASIACRPSPLGDYSISGFHDTTGEYPPGRPRTAMISINKPDVSTLRWVELCRDPNFKKHDHEQSHSAQMKFFKSLGSSAGSVEHSEVVVMASVDRAIVRIRDFMEYGHIPEGIVSPSETVVLPEGQLSSPCALHP
jgi:hypothetical protein